MQRQIIVFFFIILSCSKIYASTKKQVDILESKKAFQRGECVRVTQLLKDIEYIPYVDDERLFSDAYRMLAICYLQMNQTDKAKKEMQNLLILDPKAELDPFSTPPPVLDVFAKVKVDMEDRLREIEEARHPSLEQKPKSTLPIPDPLWAFVPFGIPQLYEGDALKGVYLGVAQAVLLTVNVGSYWWKRTYVISGTDNWVTTQQDKMWFDVAQIVQFTALGLFLGVYGYGVLDALLDW